MNEQLRQAFRKHLYTVHDCFQKVKTGTSESEVRDSDAYKKSTAWLLRFVKESSVEDVWEAFSGTDMLILSPDVVMIQETSFEFTEALLRKIQPKLVKEDPKGSVSALVETVHAIDDIELSSALPTPSWTKYTKEQREHLGAILAGTAPAAPAENKESEDQKPADQKSLLDGTQPITSQYIFDFDGVLTFRTTSHYEVVTRQWTSTTYSFKHAGDRFEDPFLYVIDKKPESFEPYKNGYVLCKDSLEVYCYDVSIAKPVLITWAPHFGRGKGKAPLIAWDDFLHYVVRWNGNDVGAAMKGGHSHEQAQLTVIEANTKDGKFPLHADSIEYIVKKIRENNGKVHTTFEPVIKIKMSAVKENIRPGIADAFRAIWNKGGCIAINLNNTSREVVKAHLEVAGLTLAEVVKMTIIHGDVRGLIVKRKAVDDVPMVYFSTGNESLQWLKENVPKGTRVSYPEVEAELWPQDPKASTAISDQTKTESLQFWVRLKENPEIFLPRPIPTWREAVVNYFYYDHPVRTVVSVLVGLALLALLFSPAGPAAFAFAGFLSLPMVVQAILAFVGGFLFSHGTITIYDVIEGGIELRKAFLLIEEAVRSLLSLAMEILGVFAWFFGSMYLRFTTILADGIATGSGLWQGALGIIFSVILATPFVATLAVTAAVFYGLGTMLQGLGKYCGYLFAELILNIGKEEEPYTINTIRALGRGLLAIPLLPFFVMRKVGKIFSDLAMEIYELGKNFMDEKKWTKSFSDNFENVAVSPVVKLAPWEEEVARKEVIIREKQGEVISTKEKSLPQIIKRHGLWEMSYDIAMATVSGEVISTSHSI